MLRCRRRTSRKLRSVCKDRESSRDILDPGKIESRYTEKENELEKEREAGRNKREAGIHQRKRQSKIESVCV